MALDDSPPLIASPSIIQSLFVHRDAVTLHLGAPMVVERERYLAALLASGRTRTYVSERATLLRHVVETLAPSDPITITDEDIAKCTISSSRVAF
jgi:hypothetical protein